MKTVGIALGGGAVLGAAHVGVLKALEEANIEISHITGTSIGAFVGAFYAFDLKSTAIEKIALNLGWFDLTKIALSKYSLLTNKKLGELIIEHLGDKNIEDSIIPLAIITTNIINGKKVVLTKGSLAKAVMASTCIPGIFKPIEMDDMMLVDGGIVENVPIDTLREIGAEYTIGVDLNAKSEHGKPGNILDVIVNSFHFIIKQTVTLQTQSADVLIKPNLSEFNMSDMSQVEELMEKGYADAKASLNKLI